MAQVSEQFKITGFSVSGRVLKKPGESGVPGTKIIPNSREVTRTDAAGIYTLNNIKPGTYTTQVGAQYSKFNDRIERIAPPNPTISDITVTGFKTCGQVVSEHSHIVSITKTGSTFHTEIQTSSGSGEWCIYLENGKYTVEIIVSEADRAEGVQFFPVPKIIEVDAEPMTGITSS